MYLRTIKRKNKDGSVVEYVQLAHNVRHPEKGYPKAEVIHSFGRREQLDVDGLKRLVTSIGRFIELDDPHADPLPRPRARSMTFLHSQPVGGVCLLRALWERLKIGECLKQALPASIEPALFALVAGAALAPFAAGMSMAQVVAPDTACHPGVSLEDRHFHQAFEALGGHTDAIRQAVSRRGVGDLELELDCVMVHLIPAGVIDRGWGARIPRGGRGLHGGHAEGTIGMAMSPTGIPIDYWLMPGPGIDAHFIESIQTDLAFWHPGQIVWVMDRQAAGHRHRDTLARAGCPYILGETLRDSLMARETASRRGRFKILGPDLQIKASIMGTDGKPRPCVIAYHPEQAAIDNHARGSLLQRLRYELDQREAGQPMNTSPPLGLAHDLQRYVKILRSGKPKIDITRVRQEEKHDGKYLLFSSDECLPHETVARGHKLLLDSIEALGAMHPPLMPPPWDRWPGAHTDAGMLLAWMSLLLVRMAEIQTQMTWPKLCREMQGLHLGEFADGNRRVRQYTALSDRQKKILEHLRIDLPPV